MDLLRNYLSPQAYQSLLIEKAARLKALAEQEQVPDWQRLVIQLTPHTKQREFIEHPAKFKVIRAGRRGGKTTGMAILAVSAFLAGKRVLYAGPTADQTGRFWTEIKRAFANAVESGALYQNQSERYIERSGTENRIRCKTAWNADSLRGDYADLLILDEYQLMSEDAWAEVGAPMLLDNNGDAVFVYTPPSLHSSSTTKARDPRHASKMFKRAAEDTSGLWATFHFRSHDNPHISADALAILTTTMTATAIRQEIEAEDTDEAPGALWKRTQLDDLRVTRYPDLRRVVVGVDPPGGRTECGIVVCGIDAQQIGYVLADYSLSGSPDTWGNEVVAAYNKWQADRVVAERNYGGDMVEHVIRTADNGDRVAFKLVQATRGKAVRAEPVAAQYERRRVFHVGEFPHLENEMVGWEPDKNMSSPNRMDALVWALTELMPIRDESVQFSNALSVLSERG